jgi:hypothetical protein
MNFFVRKNYEKCNNDYTVPQERLGKAPRGSTALKTDSCYHLTKLHFNKSSLKIISDKITCIRFFALKFCVDKEACQNGERTENPPELLPKINGN